MRFEANGNIKGHRNFEGCTQLLNNLLAVRVIYFTFSSKVGPETSNLRPDPSQTFNYSLQLRFVQF